MTRLPTCFALLALLWLPLSAAQEQQRNPFPPVPVEAAGAVVVLPADADRAQRLLDRYNAIAPHPDLVVPTLEEVLLESKRGQQAWLPVVKDPRRWQGRSRYPLFSDEKGLVLALPDIPQADPWRERIQRFVRTWPEDDETVVDSRSAAFESVLIAWALAATLVVVFLLAHRRRGG